MLCCGQSVANVNFPINSLCTDNVLVHASSNELNQLSLEAAAQNSVIQDDYFVKISTSQNTLADPYLKKKIMLADQNENKKLMCSPYIKLINSLAVLTLKAPNYHRPRYWPSTFL